MSTPELGPELVDAYARDGVVCVRGVLGPEQIELAVRGIERVLEEPSPLAQVASATEDPGRFSEDFCRWTEVSEIAELAQRSRAPAIAAALMVTERVPFYHDHVLVKEGGTKQRTPWHQDQPYYNVDGRGVRPSKVWTANWLRDRRWIIHCFRWSGLRPDPGAGPGLGGAAS